jgi:hypothetical protein
VALWNHKISLPSGTKLPQAPRFNQLWKRYHTKYIPNYYVPNCTNAIITTNYGHDGLYLPPDDGRHYVANTEVKREDFAEGFFDEHWAWQEAGGAADVVACLQEYDLSKFNPKAPPRKTPAFWVMVGAGMAPEVSELDDVIERLGRLETPPAARSDGTPCGPAALTLAMLRAETSSTPSNDLYAWLADRKNRRAIPHRLASCGYLPVASAAQDRLWIIQGKRQAVYGRRDLTPAQRVAAAAELKERLEQATRDSVATLTPLPKRASRSTSSTGLTGPIGANRREIGITGPTGTWADQRGPDAAG